MKTESALLCIVALCWSVYLAGCGGGNAAPTQPLVAPAPMISSLSPSSATAGGPQFTLTVNGANFVAGAVVTWNGNNRATTFMSSTQLAATILASEMATSGNANVSVVNPGPSSLSSNLMTFMINVATAPLLAGGVVTSAGPWLLSADLYDPATQTISPTGDAALIRNSGNCMTMLADGTMLIAGCTQLSVMAELYNPTSGTFTATGSMNVARNFQTATRLQDGRVLVGGDDNSTVTASAEIYDPKSETFALTGSMSTPRTRHTATLLSDGRVLILGGRPTLHFGGDELASGEIYDPDTGMFNSAGPLQKARSDQSATLLADGTILVAGGYVSSGGGVGVLDSAELFDPTSGTSRITGGLREIRGRHHAILLPDGSVLVTDGAFYQPSKTAEIYK